MSDHRRVAAPSGPTGSRATGDGRPIAYLVCRSLATAAEIASCDKATTIYRDRVALLAVDRDGGRWRIHVMTEPWAAPAA